MQPPEPPGGRVPFRLTRPRPLESTTQCQVVPLAAKLRQAHQDALVAYRDDPLSVEKQRTYFATAEAARRFRAWDQHT